MILGTKNETINKAIGPPITIPIVPDKNIISAFGPSLRILFRSMLSVNKTREVGNKYLEAIKYNPEPSPEMIPKVLSKEGMK
jgi:hypothetical protein